MKNELKIQTSFNFNKEQANNVKVFFTKMTKYVKTKSF